MHNIVIFEKKYGLQDNFIMADKGIMRVSPNKKFLEFVMYNGWRYQERGGRGVTNTEFTRLYFKEYKKVFDLKTFGMNKNTEIIYDPKMLSVRQLGHAIDSLQNKDSFYIKKINSDITPYLRFLVYKDSNQLFLAQNKNAPLSNFSQIIPDSLQSSLSESAGYKFSSIQTNMLLLNEIFLQNQVATSVHAIEWHRKFTLSFACIVLFLIGAPLGSIIRKGGLGTPLILAIVFFVFFFLLNNFGEKFAKSGEWTAYFGMWMSSLVLIPIGLFLTYKAMRDSQLFNQEFYYRLLNPIKVTLRKYFKK
jgi:lipopolysaccharide export system permease protein